MAKVLALCFFLFLVSSITSAVIFEDVSAIFVFGDSTVDPGNNVYVPNSISANFLPYGIDYCGGNTPTGRFSNGLTAADLLACQFGLPPAPAYLSLSNSIRKTQLQGFNYGSSGCGILNETSPPQKNCSSLSQQADMFNSTVLNDLASNPSLQDSNTRADYIANSVFYISMGANDYFFSTFHFTESGSDRFAKMLLDELRTNIERLFVIGGRRFIVNNLAPIGCVPQLINRTTGLCDSYQNKAIEPYLSGLHNLLQSLASCHKEATFLMADSHTLVANIRASPETYGFANVTGACCGAYDQSGRLGCPMGFIPCPDRNVYLFFDDAHTTEAANKLFAMLCANGIICFDNF